MSSFLGPRGQATVILFSAHFETELPKLKDLKKILSIPDGRYYKSGGNHYRNIRKLTELLTIVQRINSAEFRPIDFESTDFLITVAEVHSNLFMQLKYDAQVVEGFNLTDTNLEELDKLIRSFYDINSMRSQIGQMPDTLERNQESALENGFADQTILNPDVDGLKQLLDGYGDQQLGFVHQSILDWYEANRWKVSAPKSKTPEPQSPPSEDADQDEPNEEMA